MLVRSHAWNKHVPRRVETVPLCTASFARKSSVAGSDSRFFLCKAATQISRLGLRPMFRYVFQSSRLSNRKDICNPFPRRLQITTPHDLPATFIDSIFAITAFPELIYLWGFQVKTKSRSTLIRLDFHDSVFTEVWRLPLSTDQDASISGNSNGEEI